MKVNYKKKYDHGFSNLPEPYVIYNLISIKFCCEASQFAYDEDFISFGSCNALNEIDSMCISREVDIPGHMRISYCPFCGTEIEHNEVF